jgi:hypothetical protein
MASLCISSFSSSQEISAHIFKLMHLPGVNIGLRCAHRCQRSVQPSQFGGWYAR